MITFIKADIEAEQYEENTDEIDKLMRLKEMMEQDGMAKVNCHFCADSYIFSRSDLQIILDNSQAGRA